MAAHLVVISVDALVYEDLAILAKQKYVKYLVEHGTLIKHMSTVYPSLTHIVHTTLMTGCYPDKTGIISNEHFTPGIVNPEWFNSLFEVKCDTLFHAVKRKEMTSAACRWPVTAGGSNVIDYLVPEIMDSDRESDISLLEVHRRMCSDNIFADIVKPNIGILDWSVSKHPTDEMFQIQCACDIIRKYEPNLVMTHPSYVDATRHEFGLFQDKLVNVLEMTDQWVGQIMEAVEDAGISDTTDICVVSDHGHLNIVRSCALNVVFRNKGLLTVDESGHLSSWAAYAKGCGLSCEIYVSEEKYKDEVYHLLKGMQNSGIYGFKEMLTVEEAEKQYHLNGDFSFIVDTDGYTTFTDDFDGPVMKEMFNDDYRYGHSDHGHMPEKGPQPPMILYGPDFKTGYTIDNNYVVNEAPTFAKVLGVDLQDAQGVAIASAFRQ